MAAIAYPVASVEVGDGVQAVTSSYPLQLDFKALVPSVVTYLAVVFFVRSRTDLRLLVGAWYVGAGLNATLALVQYLTGGPHPVPLSDIAREKLNWSGDVTDVLVSGFFSHPNSFAQVVIPWFVIAVVKALTGRLTPGRVAWWVMAVALGAALSATESRGRFRGRC